MKVKILTLGTRGDVQPFLALALELKKNNYDVTICTGENFKDFIEHAGVSFAPVRVDYQKLTQSDAGKKMMSGNLLTIFKSMKTIIYPMMERMLDDLWLAAQDADVLVYNPKALGGYDIAEKLGIPAFVAHPVPIIQPTELFTNPALPFSFENGFLNKLSYSFNKLASKPFMKIINKWRIDKLGLVTERSSTTNDLRLKGWEIPVLYGCSPSVIPYDPQWEGKVAMFGFWYLDEKEEWTPSEALRKFMKEGTSPIAINFSSMPLTSPDRVKKMISEALHITGQRGILISGWSGMQHDNYEENIFFTDANPHLWLFPKRQG